MAALVVVTACDRGTPPGGDQGGGSALPAVRYDQHIVAGVTAPRAVELRNPFVGDAKSAGEGQKLFGAMNCSGCHGSGGVGSWAPSLSDGRWRYGGADGAIYQSIFYGRPEGMPAYGGGLGPEVIWKLVTYLRSLPVPRDVPTQSWSEDGND